MTNRVAVNRVNVGMRFRELKAGAFFERVESDGALWIKAGTRCVDLHTGAAKSFDQEEVVHPLADGTVVTITVGEDS